MTLAICKTKEELARFRRAGKTLALVPTMGALHAGHAALMREARKYADQVCVYIFVNPKQFGANEDLARYPRTLEADMAVCEQEGVEMVYAPAAEEVYPEGFVTNVSVGGVSGELEGALRPGHFDGVATVLAKMFIRVMPEVAVFGEKDFQQLAVVKRLVADLDLPVRIAGVPTVREADGLALSSRNVYLSAEERKIAPKLYAVMREAARSSDTVRAAQQLLAAGFAKVDYIELRDAETLGAVRQGKPARLLAAAWLGKTRLIDNIAVES